MLSLLLLTALSAAPVQVTVSRSVDVEQAEAEAFVLRLRKAVSDAGIGDSEVIAASILASCAGRPGCLREAARERGGHVLLDVELAWLAGQLGAHLSAVEVEEGASLTAHRFIVSGERYHLALDAELTRFARRLRARLPAALPWEPPRALATVPSSGDDGTRSAFSPPGPPLRKVAVGGAVATGAAAAVFAVLGLVARGQLRGGYEVEADGSRRSTIDQQRSAELASAANGRFTGALVLAGVASAFGAAALLLPSTERP